jgi:RHS repeat-associated protein
VGCFFVLIWNVYGKIVEIQRNGTAENPVTTIKYTYDASPAKPKAWGNRIGMAVWKLGDVLPTNTYYVRDASGNVMGIYESGQSTGYNLAQKEVHLYGSSRLGKLNTDVNVQSGNLLVNSQGLVTFTRGNKFFELSNHLGNVLATISDKKIPVSGNGTTVAYYTADVVTAGDYYPFGMVMPGRKFAEAGKNYRYSINGQEKEKELNENITTALYWEYDSRIGRRWNRDPKPVDGVSPYACFMNNPITHIDILGDTGELPEAIAPTSSNNDAYWYVGSIPKFKTNGTITDNPVHNIPNAIGNGIISFINIFPTLWNSGVANVQAAREGRYWQTLGTEIKGTYNGLSTAVGGGIDHMLTTPLSQQWSETLTLLNKPETLETAVAFTVPYAFPRVKIGGAFIQTESAAQAAAYTEATAMVNSGYAKLPRAVSVLYDKETGMTYYGYSGMIKSLDQVDARLKNMLPVKSYEDWTTFNCAECDVLHQAIKGGSTLRKVDIHTVKIDGKLITDFNTCLNCAITTQGMNVTSNH